MKITDKPREQLTDRDMIQLRLSGFVPLRDGTFTVWVKPVASLITAGRMRVISDLARKYGNGEVFFTTRKIPILVNVKYEYLDAVAAALDAVGLGRDRNGPAVRNADVCYGSRYCPLGLVDTHGLAVKIAALWEYQSPHKTKVSIAGCPVQCNTPRVLSDVGFVAGEQNGEVGYDVYIGGRLGLYPFVGEPAARHLSEDNCVRVFKNYLKLINEAGQKNDRGGDLMGRLGVEAVTKALNENVIGEKRQPVVRPDVGRLAGKIILRVRKTGGMMNLRQMKVIGQIAELYGDGVIHIGIWGSPEIPLVDKSRLGEIEGLLSAVELEVLTAEETPVGRENFQGCLGENCINGIFDTNPLVYDVERLFRESGADKTQTRFSVSGCPNSCSLTFLADFGFLGVSAPVINSDLCNGCTRCVRKCRMGCISMVDDKAVLDKGDCSWCGYCTNGCPIGATMVEKKGFQFIAGGRDNAVVRLGKKYGGILAYGEALRASERCIELIMEKHKRIPDIIDDYGERWFEGYVFQDMKVSSCRECAPVDLPK